jgi:hypothetical protein
MAHINLTDAKVSRLRPLASKRYDVQDALVPGLIVCVTPSGHRSFMLKRRFPGARHSTRRAIGEFGAVSVEQARETARQWLGLLDRGVDPKLEIEEQKRRAANEQALTFTVVADLYVHQRLRGHRQGARSEREIRKELIPAWGTRRITAITRGDRYCRPNLDHPGGQIQERQRARGAVD